MGKLSLETMILAAGCSLVLSYMLAAFSWRRAIHLAFIMALLDMKHAERSNGLAVPRLTLVSARAAAEVRV